MKLPIIRHIRQNHTPEQIENTIAVLEGLSELPSIKDDELDAIGEIISNCCGALEVHEMINAGMAEKDALNSFMQKVMESIDR